MTPVTLSTFTAVVSVTLSSLTTTQLCSVNNDPTVHNAYVHCSGLHCVESALCGAVCRLVCRYFICLLRVTYVHKYVVVSLLSHFVGTTHRDYCKLWKTGSLTCLPSEECPKVHTCTIYCTYLHTYVHACVSTYVRTYVRMCVYNYCYIMCLSRCVCVSVCLCCVQQ